MTRAEGPGGADHEARRAAAAERLAATEAAEEQSMTLAEYRRFCAAEARADEARAAYYRSPDWTVDSRREQAARVAQAALDHFRRKTPLQIDIYGDDGEAVAIVRQRVGGAPRRCRVHVATLRVLDAESAT